MGVIPGFTPGKSGFPPSSKVLQLSKSGFPPSSKVLQLKASK